jgi:uncharacterized protein (TIGR02466 family)
VFASMRATDVALHPERGGAFYASEDNLLKRVDVPEFRALVQFIVQSLQDTAQRANAQVWPPGQQPLQLLLTGVWFQIQNGAAFHDVHTHGNCSWSGVYYLQIDPPEQRAKHAQWGAHNGVTRFYSPMFPLLGGAHMDMGNAFMQNATLDVSPQEGELILFPAFLAHKAMPYEGERERIILSFNAQIHAPQGNQIYRYAGT